MGLTSLAGMVFDGAFVHTAVRNAILNPVQEYRGA